MKSTYKKSLTGRWIAVCAVVAICGVAHAGPLVPLHTGDINNDGFRNISDVNCFIAAYFANTADMPDPSCQAFSDTDIDMVCDGELTVADLQRLILNVLYVLSGDMDVVDLLISGDVDLDLSENSCDGDDDNDGYADDCEIAWKTDSLDPLAFPPFVEACKCVGACWIDEMCVAMGASNPADPCWVCDPWTDALAYTPLSGSPCNDDD